jgi:hypothetical protein
MSAALAPLTLLHATVRAASAVGATTHAPRRLTGDMARRPTSERSITSQA